MYFSNVLVLVLTLVLPVLGIPTALIAIEKYNGMTTGKHIVTLRPGVAPASFLNTANITATHQYTIINGFAGKFTDTVLDALRAHPDVESISEDGIMRTFATQNDAPWGLARISSINKLANQNPADLTFQYKYADAAGNGTDIYIIDSGVNVDHVDFGGRARWGTVIDRYGRQIDDNGHGTHCAGIAAGTQFGVAKLADIIVVKVFDWRGYGAVSDIVSAMQYVLDQSKTSGRPSVALTAFGGGGTPDTIRAMNALTSGGVHVIAAAGDNFIDLNRLSLARATNVIVVAASTISDTKARFSNWGSVVDIFAPGDFIMSTFIGSNTAIAPMSGSSMAAAHIAGLIAYFISTNGNLPPANMTAEVKNYSLKNKLTGVPSGTINELANNGYA